MKDKRRKQNLAGDQSNHDAGWTSCLPAQWGVLEQRTH